MSNDKKPAPAPNLPAGDANNGNVSIPRGGETPPVGLGDGNIVGNGKAAGGSEILEIINVHYCPYRDWYIELLEMIRAEKAPAPNTPSHMQKQCDRCGKHGADRSLYDRVFCDECYTGIVMGYEDYPVCFGKHSACKDPHGCDVETESFCKIHENTTKKPEAPAPASPPSTGIPAPPRETGCAANGTEKTYVMQCPKRLTCKKFDHTICDQLTRGEPFRFRCYVPDLAKVAEEEQRLYKKAKKAIEDRELLKNCLLGILKHYKDIKDIRSPIIPRIEQVLQEIGNE